MTGLRTRPVPVVPLLFEDFSGGLNMRDSATELDDNETDACLNVVFDERGGVSARLGFLRINRRSPLPGPADYLEHSEVAGAVLAYLSTVEEPDPADNHGSLYASLDGGSTWASVFDEFTAGALGAIVDYNDGVVVVNTLDGVYVFPSDLGAPTHDSGGEANMEEVRGSAIAVWQNKCWVTGDIRHDDSHSRARVAWSNAGTSKKWKISEDYVDIREVDDRICTAIGAGQGMDVTALPSLVVCKNRGYYRINDSQSGSYTTLSRDAGAASAQALASSLGRICSVNDLGVWVSDGTTEPARSSENLTPLFTTDGLNMARLGKATAGVHGDNIVFSLARAGSATPNLLIEYHPVQGWFTRHDFPLGPMALYRTGSVRKLIGCSPLAGNVFHCFTGNQDDGESYLCIWRTKRLRLNNGAQARLRRLRPWGRGRCTAKILTEFTYGAGDQILLDFNAESHGAQWGTDRWGQAVWGRPASEATLDVPLDQACLFFAVEISERVGVPTGARWGHDLWGHSHWASAVSSARGPRLLGDGLQPETGAFSLYSLRVDLVPLGNA